MKRVQHYVALLMFLFVIGAITNGNAQSAAHMSPSTSNKPMTTGTYESLKQKLMESGYKGSVSIAELYDIKGLELRYNKILTAGVKDQKTREAVKELRTLILSLDPDAQIKGAPEKTAFSTDHSGSNTKTLNTGTQVSDAQVITRQSQTTAPDKKSKMTQAKQDVYSEIQLQKEYDTLLEQSKTDPTAKMKLLVVQQALDNLKKNQASYSNTKN